MRVAFVLTGYMRDWKRHLSKNISNVIEKYDADVYISSSTYSQENWRTECTGLYETI